MGKMPRCPSVMWGVLCIAVLSMCRSPQRPSDPWPLAQAERPSCQTFWRTLPVADRSYLFERDGERTVLGNQGYRRYLDRTARAACQKEWTVLVYMAADAKELQRPAIQLLRDLEQRGRLSADADVDLIAQLDVLSRPGIRRLHVLGVGPDAANQEPGEADDPASLQSPIAWYEPDEAAPPHDSLRSFLTWGIEHYPARRYMVMLWGHGLGWRPQQPAGSRPSLDPTHPRGGIALDESQQTVLDIPELQQVLRSVSVDKLRGRPFDVLAADASLMQTVEITTELADTARYFFGSEALVDPGSLPYRAIVEELGNMRGSDERIERSSRCGRDDTTCAFALRLPLLSLNHVASQPGTPRGPHLVLSVVELPLVASTLVPALHSLGQSLEVYLREDPTRAGAIVELLTGRSGRRLGHGKAIPDFPGGTRDLGVWLLSLRSVLRQESERNEGQSYRSVLAAIDQTETAVMRSVLSLAAGSRYDEERYRGLAGLATWLPSSADDWTSQRAFFSSARFFRPSSPPSTSSWEGWLAALFAAP